MANGSDKTLHEFHFTAVACSVKSFKHANFQKFIRISHWAGFDIWHTDLSHTFSLCKNIVFPADTKYSYFSDDLRLNLFCEYS